MGDRISRKLKLKKLFFLTARVRKGEEDRKLGCKVRAAGADIARNSII